MKVFTGDIEERSLILDPNINELALNLNFFSDNRVNTVLLRFDYSFSQTNEGQTEVQVHSKSF